MSYCIKSEDRTKAVFINKDTNDLFICNTDMKESGANELYKTDKRELAVRAWLIMGGMDNGFEILEGEK